MSIASEISRLLQAKADIKIAIEGKGVTVSGSATLDDYSDLIDAIQQGSEPNLQSKSLSITANGTTTVEPDTGYDGLSDVEVSVNVQGEGGGGSQNIVTGEFIFSSNGVQTLNVPYSGNGYPVFVAIFIKDGPMNAENGYSNIVLQDTYMSYYVIKSDFSLSPNYTGSASDKAFSVAFYKSSSTSPTSYAVTNRNNHNCFDQTNPTISAASAIRIQNSTTLKIYSTDSNKGFCPNVYYQYAIMYSE